TSILIFSMLINSSILIFSILINSFALSDAARGQKIGKDHAVSPQRVRAGRPGDLLPVGAISGLGCTRFRSRGGRCPDRRLRTGGTDARDAIVRVSRHQDLHRRAEVGPDAAWPG